jgi:beta-lactam-binding protein with PASTA domain
VPIDVDWCPVCRSYVRWEPTGSHSTVPDPPVAPIALPVATPVMNRAVPAAPAMIGVLTAGDEWASNPTLRVQPGERVSCRVHIRNQRTITDAFRVAVAGLPAEWWSVEPQVAHLNPFGTGGAGEGEVTLTLHPPRTPDARAGDWSIRLLALAGDAREELARTPATVTIDRFDDVTARLTPQRRRGRRRAHYRVSIHNGGNAAAGISVAALDDAERCRLALTDDRVTLERGAGHETALRARPRRPLLIGTPVEHRIAVHVEGPGEPVAPLAATFTQRPWLPRWLPLAVPPVALLVAAALTLPTRVPEVRGMPLDEAKRELDADHLAWKPPELRKSRAPVGTVIETIPPAGAVRLRGAEVTLIVATNARRARVPDVVGKRYKDALVLLVQAGFDASDPPADLNARVTEQLPEPGSRWPRGRPVQLRFETPETEATPKPERVRVPPLAGGSLADADAALTEAGLKTKVTRVIDTEPAGTVLAAKPAKGALAPGATVALTVSAGFPALAFDDGRRLRLADGRDGGQRRTLRLAGDGRQTQPAWTPDGSRLVYRSGGEDAGRIWVADADPIPEGGRPLTEGGFDDRRPAVSPDGKVVAFVRGAERADAHRLCFVRLAGSKVSCIKDAGIGLSRPVWAPDGSTILARTDKAGLLRLTSARASSASASSWRRAGEVPVQRLGPVVSAAWSSDGVLALAVAPPDRGAPTLYTAQAGGALEPVPYGGVACELTWRSDGGEVAVAGRTDKRGNACPDRPGEAGAAARMPADGAESVPLGEDLVNPAFRPLEP